MPTWSEKVAIANRYAFNPVWSAWALLAVMLAVNLWPKPGLDDLERHTGRLIRLEIVKTSPQIKVLLETPSGPTWFMMNDPQMGPPEAHTLVPGDAIDVWSRKDGRFQHFWQLAKNGSVIIPFAYTSRLRSWQRRWMTVFGLGLLVLSFGYVELMYRIHRRPVQAESTAAS